MSTKGNRYVPFKFAGTTSKGDQWGIEDLAYNDPHKSVLQDWRKGKTKHVWRGTGEDAASLAALLNRDHEGVDFVAKGDLSLSQVIHYSNLNKQKSAPKRTIANQFKQCTCGAMYKGDKHCG